MAQQLWLLRHGEAEPHDARPDPDRRLTARGEDQSRAAGRAFKALELHFHLVFSSPKERALETARLCCEEVGCEPVVHEALSSGFDGAQGLELAAMAWPTSGSSSSATTPTSSRSSTTSPARASRSRRAASPGSGCAAAAASSSRCCARASSIAL